MALSPTQLFFSRYKRAKARADQWLAILEACYYYTVPFRNRFYQEIEAQGTFNNARLYDLTGVEAAKSFVSKIHSIMTPPQMQWGYLIAKSDDPNLDPKQLPDAQKVLGEYMRKVFEYIHKSNFDVIVNEAYFDLVIGTASLVCNPHTDKDPLLYTSMPIDQLCIEEAADGKVKTWFRVWKYIKINEITLRWKNAVLNPDMLQRMSQDPDQTVRLIEGVTFNPGEKYEYRYEVYEDAGGAYPPILSQEIPINPGIIWRFQKTNNEWWGRGPAMDALPALMRANEMAKIEFASANLNTFRPYMGFSDNVFNPHTFRLRPMTVIPIAPIGSNGQVPLIPLPDSSNPAFGQMTIGDLRAQINMLMYADPLGPIDAPAKTATELALRQQNLSEKIGPLFTRLQQEMLWPVLEITMYNLDMMGILPKPKLDGIDIQFEYRSPLALAKGQQNLAILTQYTQVMQGIMGPDVTQLLINNSEAPWVVADWMQLDTRLLNTKQDIEAMAQKMRDRQLEMQAAQQTPGGEINGTA